MENGDQDNYNLIGFTAEEINDILSSSSHDLQDLSIPIPVIGQDEILASTQHRGSSGRIDQDDIVLDHQEYPANAISFVALLDENIEQSPTLYDWNFTEPTQSVSEYPARQNISSSFGGSLSNFSSLAAMQPLQTSLMLNQNMTNKLPHGQVPVESQFPYPRPAQAPGHHVSSPTVAPLAKQQTRPLHTAVTNVAAPVSSQLNDATMHRSPYVDRYNAELMDAIFGPLKENVLPPAPRLSLPANPLFSGVIHQVPAQNRVPMALPTRPLVRPQHPALGSTRGLINSRRGRPRKNKREETLEEHIERITEAFTNVSRNQGERVRLAPPGYSIFGPNKNLNPSSSNGFLKRTIAGSSSPPRPTKSLKLSDVGTPKDPRPRASAPKGVLIYNVSSDESNDSKMPKKTLVNYDSDSEDTDTDGDGLCKKPTDKNERAKLKIDGNISSGHNRVPPPSSKGTRDYKGKSPMYAPAYPASRNPGGLDPLSEIILNDYIKMMTEKYKEKQEKDEASKRPPG